MSNFIRTAVAAGALNAGLMGLTTHEAFADTNQEAPQQETTTTTSETTVPPAETTTSTTTAEYIGCTDPENIDHVQVGDSNFYDSIDKTTGQNCGTLAIPPTPIVKATPTKVHAAHIDSELPRTGKGTDRLAVLGLGSLLLGAGLVVVEKSEYNS